MTSSHPQQKDNRSPSIWYQAECNLFIATFHTQLKRTKIYILIIIYILLDFLLIY